MPEIQNPENLDAVTPKVWDNNGGLGGLLQPKNRSAFVAQPAATAATNTTPYGFSTAAQADAIVTAVRAMQASLIAAGIMKSS